MRREADGSEYVTVHPITTHRDSPDGSDALHVLPPIYRHGNSRGNDGTTVYPLYYESSLGSDESRRSGESDDDTWLFPILAWGSDPSEGSYFLFFPFGGTLKDKLLADRIDVYAFPLYVETRAGEWESHHVLWPLIAWGDGPERAHARFIPFWSQTDGAGYGRRSLLWPFVHWDWAHIGDRDYEGWLVFPLVGNRSSTDGTSTQWTFLYPFFQFAYDEETGDEYTSLVWPIYKRAVRPGVEDTFWIWPLFGHSSFQKAETTFVAWPLYWELHDVEGRVEANRTYLVPLYMHSTTGPIGEEPTATAVRSWPLFSYQSDEQGHERLRVPEIVPVFGWEEGERVYSDFVSLFRWERDATGRTAWDGPLGIVGYREHEDGSRGLRLLWWFEIPLGGGDS